MQIIERNSAIRTWHVTKKTDILFASLLGIFMFFMPVNANAQNRAGNLNAPSFPTQLEVKERTISDLLYFPFSCVEDPMPTREQAWQVVTDIFGNCESVNLYPGLHAGVAFDFTYRGTPIGICYYDWYDKRTWYDFFFETKNEADQFYNDFCTFYSVSWLIFIPSVGRFSLRQLAYPL